MIVGGAFAANGDTDAVLKRMEDSVSDPFETDMYAGDFGVFHQFRAELANEFESLFILREQFRPTLASFRFNAFAFLGDLVEEFRFQCAARTADGVVASECFA